VRRDDAVLRLPAAEGITRDRDFMLEQIRENDSSFDLAAAELQRDREFVLAAMRVNGLALRFALEEHRRDRDVVLEAVRKSGHHALRFAAVELQREPALQPASAKRNRLAVPGAQATVICINSMGWMPDGNVLASASRGLGGAEASLTLRGVSPTVGDLACAAAQRLGVESGFVHLALHSCGLGCVALTAHHADRHLADVFALPLDLSSARPLALTN